MVNALTLQLLMHSFENVVDKTFRTVALISEVEVTELVILNLSCFFCAVQCVIISGSLFSDIHTFDD